MGSSIGSAVGASAASAGSGRGGGEEYKNVIFMVGDTNLWRFLYQFEDKILWYLPRRSRFEHLSIVMQPLLPPGSESEQLWRAVFPSLPRDKFAVCVELLLREANGDQGASWAPHIKLVTWDPRDSPITTSTYAWNLPMVLLGTHKFSQGFGRYILMWTDCQAFAKGIIPSFQSERGRGRLQCPKVKNRERLNEFLLRNDCVLNTTEQLSWLARDAVHEQSSELFFSYVALSPASHPAHFVTPVGELGSVTTSEDSAALRTSQQFYLDLSIANGSCSLVVQPKGQLGAAIYQEGAELRAGDALLCTKLTLERVGGVPSGFKIKLGVPKASDSPPAPLRALYLTYSHEHRSLVWKRELSGAAGAVADVQTWIIGLRVSTRLPDLEPAAVTAGALYQLSPASEPDRVLTRAQHYPLLSFRFDEIERAQTFVFTPSEGNTYGWILKSTTTSVYALDVAERDTRRGTPMHFWKKVHNEAHQRLQLLTYEQGEGGVQRVLIFVQHSKLFLKDDGHGGIIQDVCPNPPEPCFIWNLIPKHPLAASSGF